MIPIHESPQLACRASAYLATTEAKAETAKQTKLHRGKRGFGAKIPESHRRMREFIQSLRARALHKLDVFTQPTPATKAKLATVL